MNDNQLLLLASLLDGPRMAKDAAEARQLRNSPYTNWHYSGGATMFTLKPVGRSMVQQSATRIKLLKETLPRAARALSRAYETAVSVEELSLIYVEGDLAMVRVTEQTVADAENGPSPDDIPQQWDELVNLVNGEVA